MATRVPHTTAQQRRESSATRCPRHPPDAQPQEHADFVREYRKWKRTKNRTKTRESIRMISAKADRYFPVMTVGTTEATDRVLWRQDAHTWLENRHVRERLSYRRDRIIHEDLEHYHTYARRKVRGDPGQPGVYGYSQGRHRYRDDQGIPSTRQNNAIHTC